MCRVAGRRCPCDTSAARQLRRLAAKARAGIADNGRLQQSTVGVLETLERDQYGKLLNSPEDGFGKDSAIVKETKEMVAGLHEFRQLLKEATDTTLDPADVEAVARRDEAKRMLAEQFGTDNFVTPAYEAYEHKVREVGQAIATIAEGRGTAETRLEHMSEVEATVGKEKLALLKAERNKAFAEVQEVAKETLAYLEKNGVAGEFLDYEDPVSLDAWVARDRLLEISETGMPDTTLGFEARQRMDEALRKNNDRENAAENQAFLEHARTMTREVWRKQSAALSADQAVESAYRSVSGLVYEKRGQVYKDVLEDVSPHSFGGEFTVSDKSNKEALEAVTAAADCYPAHWIERSNQANMQLRVNHTHKRAHYREINVERSRSGLGLVKEYQEVRNEDEARNIIQAKSNGQSFRESEYRILVSEEEKRAAGKGDVEGVVIEHQEYNYAHEKRKTLKRKWGSFDVVEDLTSPYNSDFEKPKGAGWEPVQFEIEHSHFHQDGGRTVKKTTVNSWRRPRKAMMEKKTVLNSELLVDSDRVQGSAKPAGYSTAIHELAHRMEDVSGSDLSVLERTFLNRRARGEDEGLPEPTLIYGQRRGSAAEVGYRDSFASHYMGKVYKSSKYYEVMSTGAEAVFAGQYGGLIGGDGHQPDHDHRNFVLGVLANG